jgi:hypothetical protein
MEIKEEYFGKLLVEGNDDQHVIWSLCERFKIIENFDVIDCIGWEGALEQAEIRIKNPNNNTIIGIVIDADLDLQTRWNKAIGTLKRQGYELPELPNPTGTIILQEGMPKIGIWLMPNNKISGMLEDFIEMLVPQNDKLLEIAKASLKQIEELEINRYKEIHYKKALIHTWLAWQENPGTPMGLAITKKYLTTENEVCTSFVSWLEKLFS